MSEHKIVLRIHAARRLIQRGIRMGDVEKVIATGEVIERYPDDTPFPSRLLLGWTGDRPLHVLAADDADAAVTYVVTAYQPDPRKWESDLRRRKP